MHVLVYCGRFPDAVCLGALYGEDTTPVGVAALPVGRRLLTATCRMDYRIATRDLLVAWQAGGFGRAYTPDAADLWRTLCPPADGQLYRLNRRDPRPWEYIRDWADHAYAYDDTDGRVWWWHDDRWYPVPRPVRPAPLWPPQRTHTATQALRRYLATT